jgi:hypothetical protein
MAWPPHLGALNAPAFLFGLYIPEMTKTSARTARLPPAGAQTGAKLDWDMVREIRRLAATGRTCMSIAQDFGLHRETVGDVVSGRSWRNERRE